MRILVVEDEIKLASLIRRGLREEGLLADVAIKGEDALWMAGSSEYDVIVLDVMLPGIDGLETCGRLRADGVRTPILMLTARGEVADRIEGLNVGADDYLTKPFAFGDAVGAGFHGDVVELGALRRPEVEPCVEGDAGETIGIGRERLRDAGFGDADGDLLGVVRAIEADPSGDAR